MNQNQRDRLWGWLFISIVAFVILAFGVCSCSGLRKTLYVGGGGAGGAAVGSLAGPVGAISGAAVGAGVTQAVVENDELRSGTLTGEDALKAQNDELRKLVAALDGKVAAYETETLWEWAKRWTWRITFGAVWLWLAWVLAKGMLSARGREALEKEIKAAPFNLFAWLRALLAIDGVRHTR